MWRIRSVSNEGRIVTGAFQVLRMFFLLRLMRSGSKSIKIMKLDLDCSVT